MSFDVASIANEPDEINTRSVPVSSTFLLRSIPQQQSPSNLVISCTVLTSILLHVLPNFREHPPVVRLSKQCPDVQSRLFMCQGPIVHVSSSDDHVSSFVCSYVKCGSASTEIVACPIFASPLPNLIVPVDLTTSPKIPKGLRWSLHGSAPPLPARNMKPILASLPLFTLSSFPPPPFPPTSAGAVFDSTLLRAVLQGVSSLDLAVVWV